MKLEQRLHQSPSGVKSKLFDEHPLPFHMRVSPRVSKCLTGSEGVKKRRNDGVKSFHDHNLKTSDKYFQVKKGKIHFYVNLKWLAYF